MKKRMYIEIPGACARGCEECPSTHSDLMVDIPSYCGLLDDAKLEGFNWIGFCGVEPIIQPGFSDVMIYSLKSGLTTRVCGGSNARNLSRVPAHL